MMKIWSIIPSSLLKRSNIKLATRMIPSITHLSYHDRLQYLNLPSLHHRRRGDLIYLYQSLKSTYDINNIFFTLPNSPTSKGHIMKLFKHHTNSYIIRSNFYCNRVINDWNSYLLLILHLLMNLKCCWTVIHYRNYLFDFA